MRIPENAFAYEDFNKVYERWVQVAHQISMEYGVMVQVKVEYNNPPDLSLPDPWGDNLKPTRIYFKVDMHEFEGLKDLKKALDNKAFM